MSGDQLMNVKSDDLEAIWLVVDGLGQVRCTGRTRREAEEAFEGVKNMIARECQFLRAPYVAHLVGPFVRSEHATSDPFSFTW